MIYLQREKEGVRGREGEGEGEGGERRREHQVCYTKVSMAAGRACHVPTAAGSPRSLVPPILGSILGALLHVEGKDRYGIK